MRAFICRGGLNAHVYSPWCIFGAGVAAHMQYGVYKYAAVQNKCMVLHRGVLWGPHHKIIFLRHDTCWEQCRIMRIFIRRGASHVFVDMQRQMLGTTP